MKKSLITAAAVAATLATPALAGPTITSIQIKNADGIVGQGYLQLAEVQLFGGGVNYALQSAGGSATATSVYAGGSAVAANANDGSVAGGYPNIYHGDDANGGDVFTLTLGGATAIDRISIFGRTDSCCTFRDIYSFTTFNGSTAVQSGILDARVTSFATAAVPEPATWSLLILGFAMVGFGLRYRRNNMAVRFV